MGNSGRMLLQLIHKIKIRKSDKFVAMSSNDARKVIFSVKIWNQTKLKCSTSTQKGKRIHSYDCSGDFPRQILTLPKCGLSFVCVNRSFRVFFLFSVRGFPCCNDRACVMQFTLSALQLLLCVYAFFLHIIVSSYLVNVIHVNSTQTSLKSS